jgi:hypothetical protein
MRVFKTKWFARFTRSEDIEDECLITAVSNAESGLIDAVLGGGLIKQRIPRKGAGKSGGYRSIIACCIGDRYFFVYCFGKNDKDNLTTKETEDYKKLAGKILALTEADIFKAIQEGALTEVKYEK